MVAHNDPERSLNGHVTQPVDEVSFADTTPNPTAWRQDHARATGWRAREPRHEHSLKWVDREGIEHLHVVRGDSVDEVLLEVRTVKHILQAAKALAAKRQQTAPETPSAPPVSEDDCPMHHVPMETRTGKYGSWRQHTLPDGTVCKGKRQRRRA